MLRWIVMVDEPHEGLYPVGGQGDDSYPIPTYGTCEDAIDAAKAAGLISPSARRNEAAILTIEVPAPTVDTEPR